MHLDEIYKRKKSDKKQWIIWQKNAFDCIERYPKKKENNRETLARLYKECTEQIQKNSTCSFEEASRFVRSLWTEETEIKIPKSLPRIIGEDGFLRMYALGIPMDLEHFQGIWCKLQDPLEAKIIELEPLYVEWNTPFVQFYDIDATPPGILSKLFPSLRLKKDAELLHCIAKDLETISKLQDTKKRLLLSLAILSHGAAYRELEGYQILVPDFTQQDHLVPYLCQQHLIAEGLKTISLIPVNSNAAPIYLCQGTEFWPSQPSMLGSILANFGEHGSATEAYAHSWRRIHKQLRCLGKPLVAGHSMGGALAMQIGLYSHDLITASYAFNPPVPNERDYQFYHQLFEESKNKIYVIANLDDFAFWRIGAKIIGNVTIYLGKKRWKYYPVSFLDCVLLLPAFIKFIRNVHHAFPAHQCIAALYENWVSVNLTQGEIEKENIERTQRFDYLHFLPKLYDPTKTLLKFIRKIFKWRLEEEYLRNEIEILALHERDLLDTSAEANKNEIEKELAHLRSQKHALIRKLQNR